jgi:hypothetical protein
MPVGFVGFGLNVPVLVEDGETTAAAFLAVCVLVVPFICGGKSVIINPGYSIRFAAFGDRTVEINQILLDRVDVVQRDGIRRELTERLPGCDVDNRQVIVFLERYHGFILIIDIDKLGLEIRSFEGRGGNRGKVRFSDFPILCCPSKVDDEQLAGWELGNRPSFSSSSRSFSITMAALFRSGARARESGWPPSSWTATIWRVFRWTTTSCPDGMSKSGEVFTPTRIPAHACRTTPDVESIVRYSADANVTPRACLRIVGSRN